MEEKTNTDKEGEGLSKDEEFINSAKEQSDRLEAANKKQEELIIKQTALYERQQLGGNSQAGQIPPEPAKETDEEFTKRFEKGEVDLTK